MYLMRLSRSSATGGTCAGMVVSPEVGGSCCGSARSVRPEVSKQRDLGAVVDHFAVDVEDQLGAGMVGPGSLRRAARLGQLLVAPTAHAREPRGIPFVELPQGDVSGARIVEGLVVDR